jgi:DNA-binding IclR family transcriptional regulator
MYNISLNCLENYIRFAAFTMSKNDKFYEHLQWTRLRKIVLDDGQTMVETCAVTAPKSDGISSKSV